MINIIKVDCYGDGDDKGDPYTYLIINNKIVKSGDFYHDKIHDYILGFVDGVHYTEKPMSFDIKKIIFDYIEDALDLTVEQILEKIK